MTNGREGSWIEEGGVVGTKTAEGRHNGQRHGHRLLGSWV